MNFPRSTEQLRPLAHADQSEPVPGPLGVRELLRVKALAVVLYRQDNGRSVEPQPQRHVRRIRVLGDVRQTFLRDTVQGNLDLWVKVFECGIAKLNPGSDFVCFFKFPAQEVQRNGQTKIVKHGGAQVGRKPPHFCDGLLELFFESTERPECPLVLRLEIVFQHFHIEFHAAEALTDIVMQFPGNPLPFILLGPLDGNGEAPQVGQPPFLGFGKFFLERPLLGDVARDADQGEIGLLVALPKMGPARVVAVFKLRLAAG